MQKWQEGFLKAIENNPLIVYKTTSIDYISMQLATPLYDDDDAILLYLIDEGDGEYSLSDQAWMATLLPYEETPISEDMVTQKAVEQGFSLSGLMVYKMVNEENINEAIESFDRLIKTLQGKLEA